MLIVLSPGEIYHLLLNEIRWEEVETYIIIYLFFVCIFCVWVDVNACLCMLVCACVCSYICAQGVTMQVCMYVCSCVGVEARSQSLVLFYRSCPPHFWEMISYLDLGLPIRLCWLVIEPLESTQLCPPHWDERHTPHTWPSLHAYAAALFSQVIPSPLFSFKLFMPFYVQSLILSYAKCPCLTSNSLCFCDHLPSSDSSFKALLILPLLV